MTELPDYVLRNRSHWDSWAHDYEATGRRNWAQTEATWGIWGVPESQVGMLPDDLDGLDAIELGCGNGYVSAWLARRGARPVGIDNSRGAARHGAAAPGRSSGSSSRCCTATPRSVPFPDASFDLAISEYGASIWCDPYRWIPEAARLLRPGGGSCSWSTASLLMLCVPEEDERRRRPTGCCGRSSGCTASSGPTTTRSSSTCPTAR